VKTFILIIVTLMNMNQATRDSVQRKAMLDYLLSTKDHPTARDIFSHIRSIMPSVSMGNVYRNLEILLSQGLVKKIELGSGSRFDANTSVHAHIRCQSCGKVEDVEIGLNVLGSLAKNLDYGYEISGYSLEFMGLCPDCKKITNARYNDVYGLELLVALKKIGQPVSCPQIALETGRHPQSVNGKLKNLVERGLVTAISKGIYKITQDGLECIKEEK
jgi:Fe2+ or Zn2+ uptake regulation protein